MTPAPRIRVLGPVSADGPAPPGTNVRALLVSLVLAAPRPRSVDGIAADVWGEDAPQHPKAAVQSLVSRLRRATSVVTSTPAGYALSVEDTDLHVARRALATGVGVEAALALWTGEPGADLEAAPIAAQLRAEAEGLHASLLRAHATSLLADGRADDAAALAAELAAAQPADESLVRLRMRALAAAGRADEAAGVFTVLRTRLREHAGTSPAAETAALHAELLRENAADPIRVGVRAEPNTLYGRDDDITAVLAMLRGSRIVTVLGTGGLGKTRLANAVAASSDAPAVVLVPLASVRDAGGLVPAIAAALGVDVTAGAARLTDPRQALDLAARVQARLAERRTLLVLDNCEQIVDAVAVWCADAVAHAAALTVLTTSRAPLELAAEAVYPLAPLSAGAGDGPAAQLLRARTLAVRPDADLPADVVEDLCRRLDGLPLAIELAAARARTMSLVEIRDRLGDRFTLLRGRDRTAPDRHRTLEAVIAWSWDLLDERSRQAMTALSMFPAGCSSASAASVIGADAPAVLDTLVTQSLLQVTEAPGTGRSRLRMLETVREYAAGRADERAVLDDALAAWALAFAAARSSRPIGPSEFADTRDEHDNLVHALRGRIEAGDGVATVTIFGVLAQEWIIRGALSEMLTFAGGVFDAAVRLPLDAAPPLAFAAVCVLSASAQEIGMFDASVRLIARLRSAARRGAVPPGLLAALADLVDAAADGRLPQAVAATRTDPDPLVPVLAELLLAHLAENGGEVAAAGVAARRAHTLATDAGFGWLAAMAATTAAQVHSQSAEPHDALRWLDRAATEYAAYAVGPEHLQQSWVRGANLVAVGRLTEARALFTALADSTEEDPDGADLPSIGWFGLAEAIRADGADASGAYLHAIGLFGTAEQRGAPWYLMALAAFVTASASDGTVPADELADWAGRLRARGIAVQRARPQFVDLPLFGTVLTGWGAWALSVPSLRGRALDALALAEACRARQDLPSLHLAAQFARASALIGAADVAAARTATATVQRDELVARAVAVLTG